MQKSNYLHYNNHILKDKTVLDLACHDGTSTDLILKNGAKHVYAIDIRSHLIEKARSNITGPVDFFVGDITNDSLTSALIEQSDTVACFGVLYHLFDHFRFFKQILRPNIEHVLMETLFGPETLNPEMVWGFETTNDDKHGWMDGVDLIPNGTPNLSWIIQSSRIFGFECDWVHCYGNKQIKKSRKSITHEEYTLVAGPDWPPYVDIISNVDIPEFVEKELEQMLKEYLEIDRRMILRLYNTKLVDSIPLKIKDIYQWPL
jgi:SAM-dependent methyltransferase